MRFTCSRIGSVVFFRLAGNLGVGTDLTTLDAAVTGMSDPSVQGIFLDLAHVARLDCTGIGEIVRLRSAVGAAGLAFGLVNVDARHRRMLEMARLTPFFDGHEALTDTTVKPPPMSSPQTNILGVTRHFYSAADRFVSDSSTEFALV